MSQPAARVIGLLAEDARACFHALRVLIAAWPIPSRPRLFRVSTMSVAAPGLSTGATYLGFLPSSRHHPRASTSPPASLRTPAAGVRPPRAGHPKSRYVPSSGFLGPSTVFSARWLRGLVASRDHVQGLLLFKGLAPAGSEPSSSEDRCPLAVARNAPDRPKPIAGAERPRLRGFAPLADSNDVRLPARAFIPSSGFRAPPGPMRCRQ